MLGVVAMSFATPSRVKVAFSARMLARFEPMNFAAAITRFPAILGGRIVVNAEARHRSPRNANEERRLLVRKIGRRKPRS